MPFPVLIYGGKRMKKVCMITGGYVIGCFALIGFKYMLERIDKKCLRSHKVI